MVRPIRPGGHRSDFLYSIVEVYLKAAAAGRSFKIQLKF